MCIVSAAEELEINKVGEGLPLQSCVSSAVEEALGFGNVLGFVAFRVNGFPEALGCSCIARPREYGGKKKEL